jgi:hypothetical protein
MSHSVNIKTQFKNISNLLAQFEKMGWTITQNAKCRTYPSDPRREEVHKYVAKNPLTGSNKYDIGIDVDSEGNAYFVCDFFDPSIQSQLGDNLTKIKQGYALDELKKFLHEEDLDYKVDTLPTGEMVVIAEK